MKMKKTLTALLSGIFAVSAMTCTASAAAADILAAGDELVVTPEDMQGLTRVSDSSAEVKFVGSASYSGMIGGEDNGQWLLGGDNGDTGFTIEDISRYSWLEIDYSCTLENGDPFNIENVLIGAAFKVHIKDRVDDSGNPVYYDYLPGTWVQYGPQGTEGKGTSVNALQTIYQTELKSEGTISVPVEKLLEVFEDDSDYIMGIGFGADNNTYIPEENGGSGTNYTVTCKAIRLTNQQSANAGAPFGSDAVEEKPAETEAPAQTEAPAETEPPVETEAPAETTPAQTSAPVGGQSENSSLMIILILAAVVIVAAIVVIIIVSKKR